MRAFLVVVLVGGLAFAAVTAHADDKADAKKHFDAGLVLMESEDFAAAAAEFEASVGLYATKGAVFNLANCYKALRKYRESLVALESLEREFGKILDAEMKRSVAKMRKEIETVICTIKVRVKKAGALIYVDGELIGKSPLPSSATVGPGEHEVRVELSGSSPVIQNVKLISGDIRELEFALDGTDALVATVPAAPGGDTGGAAFVATVVVDPKDAHAAVDGRGGWKLTPHQFPVAPGAHRLEIKRSGFRKITYQFVIESQNVIMNAQMDRPVFQVGIGLLCSGGILAGIGASMLGATYADPDNDPTNDGTFMIGLPALIVGAPLLIAGMVMMIVDKQRRSIVTLTPQP